MTGPVPYAPQTPACDSLRLQPLLAYTTNLG